MTAASTDVLLVVDVQNGFCPGGGLAVPHGDEVVPVINRVARRFENVVLTQDWHPPGHVSFASSHPGREPYQTIDLAYGAQVLWPDHCVQASEDAALHPELSIPHAQLILRKGYHAHTDSYSAFVEADRRTTTGLEAWLKARGLRHVFVVGLATDFCVAWTALDARSAGFATTVIDDACRAIDIDGSLDGAWRRMHAAGVHRVRSGALETIVTGG